MRIRPLVPCAAAVAFFALVVSQHASHATDPPAPQILSLGREPAFNPAAPLLGRVQLKDDTGAVLHHWTSHQPNDLFGLSAIITPDVNGDGVADVAIATPNAFDDVAGVRVGAVVIKSGADGSTLTAISGTPLERFGLALFARTGAEAGAAPTLTVLVEALDPSTNAPSGSFTFQSFDAFSGAFLVEAVQAPSGFTAQAAEDSLAIYIRAKGSADLNASGTVTTADLSILANNYGTSVDPITGQLLQQNPSLAAAPTGDTNGDGVVDAADLNNVISNIGNPSDPNHVPIDESLTEAEAAAVEAGFGEAVPQWWDCKCGLCPVGWCMWIPNPFEELDEGDGPEFDDGDEGTVPPEGGGGPPTSGGGGPSDGGPYGDPDGDGIPNKDDCSSPMGGASANCECDDEGVIVKTDIGADTDLDGTALNDPDEIALIDHDGDENADPPVPEESQTDPIEFEDIGRPGLIILVNDDDDDLDGTPDREQTGPLQGYIADNELVPMHLQITPNRVSAGNWMISFDSERFRVWNSRTRNARWYANSSNSLPVPLTVYVEAIAPSVSPGDASFTLSFIPNPANCASDSQGPLVSGSSKLTDMLRATAVRLEMFDLRHWGPRYDANTQRPYIQNRNLDNTGLPVGGAITDGASICLLRLKPPMSQFMEDGRDDDGNGHVDDEFWEVIKPDQPYNGIEVDLQPREGGTTHNPDIVGSVYPLKRPVDPDGFGPLPMWSWDTVASDNQLPELPVIETDGGRETEDVSSPDGLWFYVPPEGFVEEGGLHPQTGEVEKATLTIPIRFNGISRGNMDFILRRPPIVLVHGLMGSAVGYWSSTLYTESAGRPLPTRLYYCDYQGSNTLGYKENYGYVGRTAYDALMDYRLGRDDTPDNVVGHSLARSLDGVHYAATRVDAVGHSMGGQLIRTHVSDLGNNGPERVYRGGKWPFAEFDRITWGDSRYINPANWGAGNIRRFVTVGSPFQGSPIANNLVDALEPAAPETVHPWERSASMYVRKNILSHSPAGAISNYNGEYVPPTAVSDLCVGSEMQRELAKFSRYPRDRQLPGWIAIAGKTTTMPAYGTSKFGPFKLLALRTVVTLDDDSVGILTAFNSDLVVQVLSQLNVLNSTSPNASFPTVDYTTHTFEGLLPPSHSSEVFSQDIADIIKQVLDGQVHPQAREGRLYE